MHADEAILADKFGTFLEHGSYQYDPAEHHGPLLEYVSTIPAYLAGQTRYRLLTETTLRLVPAVAGVLLTVAPVAFTSLIGSGAALCAALLIAVSPAGVFYSRYYIPEMLLALLTAAFLVTLEYASRTRSRAWWALAGASAALAMATKETAVIALAAAIVPFVWYARPRVSPWFFVAFAVILPAVINPLQLGQGLLVWYGRGVSGSVHAQPPWYYLRLLAEEPVTMMLALGALLLPSELVFVRVLKGYALLMTGIYSAIPYKTPWCVVSIAFAFALLAGIAWSRLFERQRWLAGVILVGGAAYLGWRTWDSSFLRPTDPAIPWVYAQTGEGVYTIRDAVRKHAGEDAVIAIYTTRNLWPLPWYLREFPNARWSTVVPPNGAAPPIVLTTPEMEGALLRKIYEGPPPGERELYMSLFTATVYLRPGVEVRGYVRRSVWESAR